MSILNDKYKKITEQRKNISIELKELLENESVKRYFELSVRPNYKIRAS